MSARLTTSKPISTIRCHYWWFTITIRVHSTKNPANTKRFIIELKAQVTCWGISTYSNSWEIQKLVCLMNFHYKSTHSNVQEHLWNWPESIYFTTRWILCSRISYRDQEQIRLDDYQSFTLPTGTWAEQMKWVKELASNDYFFPFNRNMKFRYRLFISLTMFFLFVSKTCNQFINVDQMQKRAHNTLLFGIWFPLVSKLKSCYWTVSMKTNQFLIYIVVMYRGIDGVHSLASSLSKVIFKEKLLFMIEHLHLDTESVWASTACHIANMDLCECYGVAEHFSKRLKSHFIALESSEKHDINYDKT